MLDSRIYALDAKTGQKLWKYEHRLPEGIMPCCDVINRGAALYGDLVIFGTLDGRQIVALNRDTGKVVWREKIDDYKAGYDDRLRRRSSRAWSSLGCRAASSASSAASRRVTPRPARRCAVRPVVEGHMGYKYDKDGKEIENGISGTTNATWPGDLWKTGGAATWQTAYYDPDAQPDLHGNTANPAPWNSWLRPGDNLYSSSTVAVDPDIGKIVWHYQNTPHDGWDFERGEPIHLLRVQGSEERQPAKAGAKADRYGFFFVNDRTNGKLLGAYPFLTRIDWAKGYDLETGRPITNDDKRPPNPFAEGAAGEGGKGKPVFAAPSFLGGKNQMPMGYSPDTGLFYVPANEWGMDIWNEPVSYKRGAAYLGAGFTIKPLYEDYIGAMRAIDPVTGKIVWEVKNNAPLWGGVLSTGGNLVFDWHARGLPEGGQRQDRRGGVEFQTGSGVIAPPVTWKSTASSTSQWSRAGAARCRCGAATSPSG